LDIDSIPLNVSRENLQNNKVLTQIKEYVVSKTIGMISKLSANETSYADFIEKYGGHIKLGIISEEKEKRKESLAELLRFRSSFAVNGTSLEKYVERMKPNQTEIYFVTGSSFKEMRRFPQIEKAIKHGFEVLYLDDTFDEYLTQSLSKFRDYSLRNLVKSGFVLPSQSEDEKKALEDAGVRFKPFIDFLKKHFKKVIEKVVISGNLESSPMTITSSQFGWTAQMERMMKGNKNDPMSRFLMNQRRIMEINPNHELMNHLLEELVSFEDSKPSEEFKLDVQILYEASLLHSGYDLSNPAQFAVRVEDVLRSKYGLSPAEKLAPTQEDSVKTGPLVSFGGGGDDFGADDSEEPNNPFGDFQGMGDFDFDKMKDGDFENMMKEDDHDHEHSDHDQHIHDEDL